LKINSFRMTTTSFRVEFIQVPIKNISNKVNKKK